MSRYKKRQSIPSPLGPGSHVVILARDSGHQSQEKSVDDQLDTLRQWAKEQSWIVVREYADRGYPGSTDDRPAFQQLMADSQDGNFQAVLVWELSRFSRDEQHAAFYAASLAMAGVQLLSKTENIPPEIGSIYRSLIGWMNQKYVERLAINVRRGQHANIAAGLAHGGFPPVGYKAERVQVSVHRDGKPRYASRWVIDEDKAPLVRKAFEMRAAGHPLADILKVTRLHTSEQGYARMFRNPAYIGTYRYGSESYPDAFLPIIERQLWNAVQALPTFPPKVINSQYLLSGLVRCGVCGTNCVGHTRFVDRDHPKRYHYYCCSAKLKVNWFACTSKPLRAERLEAVVLGALADTILSDTYVWHLVEAAQKRLGQSDTGNEVERIAREVARIQRAITDLYDLAGGPGWEGAKRKMRELEAEQRRLEGERVAQAGSSVIRDVTLADVERFVSHWRGELASEDFSTRQRQLRQLISAVTVGLDGDIAVEFRQGLF